MWLEGVHETGAIDEQTYQMKLKRVDQPIFPGSQPVSLSYANESLIYEKRYATVIVCHLLLHQCHGLEAEKFEHNAVRMRLCTELDAMQCQLRAFYQHCR